MGHNIAGKADLRARLEELESALEEARTASMRFLGWQRLQVVKETGATHVEPYVAEAIESFEEHHDYDEEDPHTLHHLAIAHHARAWALELEGTAEAQEEWVEALKWWREVRTSGRFWQELEAKAREIAPDFDTEIIAELRGDLSLHLLHVHLDFIRYYYERGEPGRARTHIEIVRQAQIQPVVRRQLEPRLCQAITCSVAEDTEAGEYERALGAVRDFLELVPNYPEALRMAVEIHERWITRTSPETHWDRLCELQEQAWSFAEQLAAHPQLAEVPLGATVLEDLAEEVVYRFRQHMMSVRDKYEDDEEGLPADLAKRVRMLDERRLAWLRLVSDCGAVTDKTRETLCWCAYNCAVGRFNEGDTEEAQIAADEAEQLAKRYDALEVLTELPGLRAAILHSLAVRIVQAPLEHGRDHDEAYRKACDLLEEAATLKPDDDGIRDALETVRGWV